MPRLSKIGAAALAAFGWTTGAAAVTADYLVVAGGGGGGSFIGGGGGAGGMLTGTTSLSTTASYTVTVGAGGSPDSQGGNSVFNAITSTGGGKGGVYDAGTGGTGGSGGGGAATSGATSSSSGGSGTSGQGTAGGSTSGNISGGSGGGGKTDAGGNASNGNGANGGNGASFSISGSSVTYAGGGGGGARTLDTGTGGTGGSGGGGRGGGPSGTGQATSGTANLGGGGGGYGFLSSGGSAGSGGSGIVIISYVGVQQFGGGVVTSSGGNTIHTFTTSGTLSPLNSLTANFLVVAGGGGGGGNQAGGGGAGGLRSSVTATGGGGSLESALTIDTNSIYLVTVGAGGAGNTSASRGTSGGNSAFLNITSTGGGGGGGTSAPSEYAGATGGSGGGGAQGSAGGAGTANQGRAGGTGNNSGNLGGGGGGGASTVGADGTSTAGGNGGAGVSVSITGSSVTYAGGGGGGTYNGGTAGTGGAGGGANGNSATAASANTGGGGGGGSNAPVVGGSSGGSGVVIISYPGSTQQMAGGTVTVAGGNVIHTFTSSGYLTPIVLVNNSLRFRASATAYLNRTGSTATNAQKATYSFWFKRGALTTGQWLFTGGASGAVTLIGFNGSSDAFSVLLTDVSGEGNITTALFRDPSAWYHFVIAIDTTQTTTADRAKIYVNGVLQTVTVANGGIGPNANWGFNTANTLNIGRYIGASSYTDGYMTEINFIDGLALTPFSFGSFNGLGVWQPIRYGGSYGTNGFYLPFTNTTSTTTLGYDFSPNGNNWTTNNISLTAGSTYDSMTDVPTNTSATVANYAVLNPLANPVGTLANGNLQISTTTNQQVTTATMALPSTGQYYFEITATDYATGGGVSLGLVNSPFLTTFPANGTYIGIGTYSGNYNNGTSSDTTNLSGADVTNDGDIWCIAIDVTNNKFWAGRSRSGTLVWADGVTPAVNGSGASTLSLPTGNLYPMIYRGGSYNEIYNFNFGQQPFAHTPPTGFVRLNTFNLTTPTIGATPATTANKYFNISLYTGTGATQTIANSSSMQPDFIWFKSRALTYSHALFDSVRGVTQGLDSDTTATELTSSAGNDLSAFTSTGFTVGPIQNWNSPNNSSSNPVAWQWRASNTTAVTNTAGSINSTVSSNTTAGFSIVTYTGNATSGSTVGHGCQVGGNATAPNMVILKSRTVGTNWYVYHSNLTSALYQIYLNITSGEDNSVTTAFNSVAPGATTFTLPGTGFGSNNSGATYVAYCFAAVPGYSAFGSYTGNGDPNGTFVYLGFRPRFIILKRINPGVADAWIMMDTAIQTYNVVGNFLQPSQSDQELYAVICDFLSNGFKLRETYTTINTSGGTYIYMAFAESPFKYANAR